MASIALPPQVRNIIVDARDYVEPDEQGDTTKAEVFEDDGEGNHELPQNLQDALKQLLVHYGNIVDKVSRRDEVRETRRQRFYWANQQYIYFNKSQQVFIPLTAGVVMSVGSDSVSMPRYCAVYNIYTPYGRNYTATLCQNQPGVNFLPIDPGSALDIKKAEAAEKYSGHYDQVNDVRFMQARIGRLFWTDGRVVGWTRNVVNGEKYGHDLETGEERSEEITNLYGVLECKVFPMNATEQDELTGCIISDDPDINRAKADYPWIAEEIVPGPSGTGESAFERNSRLGILQGQRTWVQSEDSYSHLTERHFMFLRPSCFKQAPEVEAEQLEEMFPDGVRVTFVGGKYAEAYPESFDDCITVRHALEGDGMNRPSWGASMVPVQNAYNNYRNFRQEMHDYGAPWTGVDTQLIDQNALHGWVAQPGEIKPLVNPTGERALASYFYSPEAASVPTDMIQAEQDLRGELSQLISAVQPSLFGGQIAKDDRVGVYQMAREQAMGVMALVWGVMQGMFASFKRQAVLAAAAKRKAESIIRYRPKVRGKRRSKFVSVSISDLQGKGNFRAVPDTDTSFPVSRQMKNQAFKEVMAGAEMIPSLAEAAQQPDNMELGLELEGLATDFDIPAARAWRRQMTEIDELLETGPIPPGREQVEAIQAAAMLKINSAAALQASAQGQPAGQAPQLPPELQGPTPEQWADPKFMGEGQWLDNQLMMSLAKCSVPIQKRDFHAYHLAAIKDWLNSEAWEKEMEAGNRLGLANLELHAQEHEKLAPPDQPGAGAKPPSESINFKDLPPEGQVQLAAKGGIQINPPAPQMPPAQAGAQGPQMGAGQ